MSALLPLGSWMGGEVDGAEAALAAPAGEVAVVVCEGVGGGAGRGEGGEGVVGVKGGGGEGQGGGRVVGGLGSPLLAGVVLVLALGGN